MPRAATAASDEKKAARAHLFDPFCQGVELPLRATVYPLGFSLELQTNSAAILESALSNWSGFPKLFDEPPIRLKVAVDERDLRPCPTTLQFRAQEHLLLMLSDPGNYAVCDLARGFVFCWISAATAKNPAWFRYFYLDTIAYLVLWHQHLTRIHAACVALDGAGVLLCGPSGAGKSCLAYACARSGWTYITDEAVSLVRRSQDRRVLGKFQHVRFRETASLILPELNGRLAARDFAGKMTVELGTANLAGFSTDFQCRAGFVVFLDREAPGKPRLVPLERTEAMRRLEQDLPLFDRPVHEEHRNSIRRLLEVPVFQLCSYDLASGVRLLESLVRGGRK